MTGWNRLSILGVLALGGCATTTQAPKPEVVESRAPQVTRDELQRMSERLSKGPLDVDEVDAFYLVAQQLFLDRKLELAEKFYTAVFEVRPTLVVGFRLSDLALLNQRFEVAERIVLQLRTLFPKSLEPAIALSRIQFRQGKNDDALRTLKDLLVKYPNDEQVSQPYVDLLLHMGRDAEARAALLSLVKGRNANPYFLQKLAEMEIKGKRLQEAKKLLDRLLRIAPENVEGWTLAGFIAMEEKDDATAERYFREAHLKQPDNDTLARYYVLQLLRQDKFREARRILVKLEGGGEAGQGLDPELTFQLGYVLFQLDDFEESRKRFLAVADKLEDPGRALFFVGQCEESLKRLPQAQASYERVPQSSKLFKQSTSRRVYLRLESGQMDEARALLPLLTLQDDSEEGDYRSLGMIHARLKEHKKAIAIAEQGLKKFPESADLAFHAATWLEFVKTPADAQAAVEAVLRKHPDHPQSLNYVAYSLAERGERLDAALRMAEKAVRLLPKDAFLLDTLGWVLFKLGRSSEAELQLVRALAIEPDEPIVYEHLGEVLYARSNLAGALQHFEAAERKFAAQPQWKVEIDREWRESRVRVQARIAEIRKKALP